MKFVTLAAWLGTAAAIAANPVLAETVEPPAQQPLVLIKAPLDTFELSDFPWGLPEGETKDVHITLGDAVLTMPSMTVTHKGEDALTITAPDLVLTKNADWQRNGGIKANDVKLSYQRRSDSMLVAGNAKTFTISDGDTKEARGAFEGFDFILNAGAYDLAIEAIKDDAEAGTPQMRAAMAALDLSLDYSIDAMTFVIGSKDTPSSGAPGSFTLESGPAKASLVFGDGRLSLEAESTDNAFAADAMIPVSGEVALIAYGFDMPVEASKDPQGMQFGLELGKVEVGDQIWSMADPKGLFQHALDHVKADVSMNVVLKESMFDTAARNARKLSGGRALDPLDMTLNAFEFDGLGLDVSSTGNIELEGERPTAISAFLSVAGLSEFMANAVKAGFLPQPQAIMAEGIAIQFAEEKPDGSLEFDIQTRDGMIAINDKPVVPLPK